MGRIGPRDREAVLAYLERAPRLNLALIDHAQRLGSGSGAGVGPAELLGAWRDGQLIGVASLQPSVVLDAAAERDALEAFLPYLGGVGSGLIKSTEDVVTPIEHWLRERRRRTVLDRIETGYVLPRGEARLVAPPSGVRLREARPADLEALVEAARASLREEDRPDPFQGDPQGFRRWVQGRVGRALVAESEGRLRFVGYADVRSERGWLLQGIYTWPGARRRGLGAAGVSELCRRAFDAGASHVQLAVVEGNREAGRLYERLGFRAFARLRTLLFL